jgi:hypothetical protein
MDPNQAYEDWLFALTDNNREAAVQAAEALLGWLQRDGFAPHGWTDEQRSRFVLWCCTEGVGSDEPGATTGLR